MKNGMVEDEASPEFEDQMLKACHAFITSKEPAMYHFYPLRLYQNQNTTCNKCELQFGKEGRILPYTRVGKPLHDRPTSVRVQGDNNCYFHSIV